MAAAEALEPQARTRRAAPRRGSRAAEPLFATPAGEPDDLKKITGVGPVLEKKLNALGITRFDQIANLSDEDIAKVDDALNSQGPHHHATTGSGQAKRLATGELSPPDRRFRPSTRRTA